MNAEQEIVKPYLDELKENISFLDTYDDIEVEDEFGNTNRTKYVDFYEVMETIDDLLSGEKTMKREEAIVVIKTFIDNPLFSDEHKAAFNIAIHDIERMEEWNMNELILVRKGENDDT